MLGNVATPPWALEGLPTFSSVALRLIKVLSEEDAVLEQALDLIRMDARLSAGVLRLANSAAFGFSREIETVEHAIALLGPRRVKALTETVALGMYMQAGRREPMLEACWRHSLACAFLSERLAPSFSLPEEAAYGAGLLHDIGRMALLVAFPDKYARLIEAAGKHCVDLLDLEWSMFGLNHCEAGEWLVRGWGFPALRELIGSHHQNPADLRPGLPLLISTACRLADALGFAFTARRPCSCYQEIRRASPDPVRRYLPSNPAELADLLELKLQDLPA